MKRVTTLVAALALAGAGVVASAGSSSADWGSWGPREPSSADWGFWGCFVNSEGNTGTAWCFEGRYQVQVSCHKDLGPGDSVPWTSLGRVVDAPETSEASCPNSSWRLDSAEVVYR